MTRPTPIRFHVERIVDGDTFKVLYDGDLTSVRILGIDTPERGQPGFQEATAATRDLIEGQAVTLTFEGKKRDRFGRLLAYVATGECADVGAELLRRGLADVYRKKLCGRAVEYSRLEREAE